MGEDPQGEDIKEEENEKEGDYKMKAQPLLGLHSPRQSSPQVENKKVFLVKTLASQHLRGTNGFLADLVKALELLVKGHEEGLYPRCVIKARDYCRLFNVEENLGFLGRVGRGLAHLEKMGLLRRVTLSNSRGARYRVNCFGRCFGDSWVCGYLGTPKCPLEKARRLLVILKGG